MQNVPRRKSKAAYLTPNVLRTFRHDAVVWSDIKLCCKWTRQQQQQQQQQSALRVCPIVYFHGCGTVVHRFESSACLALSLQRCGRLQIPFHS